MTCLDIDVRIRLLILFEYCKRDYGKSCNPQMHFYVIPELRDTDNDIIKTNAIYLIDKNFVRGGVDDDGSQTFPWIRRITNSGMALLEQLIDESKKNIPEMHDELKDDSGNEGRIASFIDYCLKSETFSYRVLDVAKNIFP